MELYHISFFIKSILQYLNQLSVTLFLCLPVLKKPVINSTIDTFPSFTAHLYPVFIF